MAANTHRPQAQVPYPHREYLVPFTTYDSMGTFVRRSLAHKCSPVSTERDCGACALTVREVLQGVSEEELARDRMRRLALERLLEIVSLASSQASLKAAENGVDWQAIADISDRLENTRDRIKTRILWTISQDKLLPLKACAERQLCEPS